MTREEVVKRALSTLGHLCKYALGKGGYDPAQPWPWADAAVGCDCSGFVAWCLGLSRNLDGVPAYERWNGGWLETTAVYRDARSPYGFFRSRSVAERIEEGDIVVWPDGAGTQGHMGLVVESGGALEREAAGLPPATLIIHCSRGNWRRNNGDAIAVTGPEVFNRNNAIVAVYEGFDREDET